MNRQISKRVDIACEKISGFKERIEQFKNGLLINGRTHNTFTNYSRKLAELSLYFKKLPEHITEPELVDYLALIIKQSKSVSQSEFKHIVYSMRSYFKLTGLPMNVKLPQIKSDKKLPVVLSKQECRLLFSQSKNFKHRLILKFIYACGLRVNELLKLKWQHIDTDRMTVLIKRSKGNKDRYVPLSEHLLVELISYMTGIINSDYVFKGGGNNQSMSASGIRFLMRGAVKRAGIIKEGVCLHTLRHSFATHLLEDGLDIISIKELLGHERIETTLVYLHVCEQQKRSKSSPLDTLMDKTEGIDLVTVKEKFNELFTNRNLTIRLNYNQMNLFE